MIKNPKLLFYKGMFSECLEHYENTDKVFPVTIGAMVFLGKIEEARASYKKNYSSANDHSEEDYFLATFFMILGLVRVSEYKEAELTIDKLRSSSRNSASYVIIQAEAFLDYYYGRTNLSLEKATAVYRSALAENDLYFQILSLDLMGHAHIQKGEVFQAIDYFKQALKHSQKIKNKALVNTLELTIRKFELRFFSLDKATEFLIEETDHYSHLDLSLEIINQTILRSEYETAQKMLNDLGTQVYIKKNRRQMAKFQLRYCFFHLVKGQPMQALNLIEATEKYLVAGVDNELLLQLYGLKFDIYKSLAVDDQTISKIKKIILELSQNTQSLKNEIFLYRRGLTQKIPQLLSSNDSVGEMLIALKSQEQNSRDLILKNKLSFFLYEYYGIKYEEQCLLIDLKAGQGVRFCHQSGVHLFELTSELFVTMLRKFADEKIWSKQQMLESAWGIKEYNPLHHDPLLYQAIARLRKMTQVDWVLFNESGIEFKHPIYFVEGLKGKKKSLKKEDQQLSELSENDSVALISFSDSLNYRQLGLLNHLKVGEFIQPGAYRKKYSIGTMTAYRDLQDLTDMGYLVKRGNARSTSYWRAK